MLSYTLRIGHYGLGFTYRNSNCHRYFRLRLYYGNVVEFEGMKYSIPYTIDFFRKEK